jgi:nuclear autoantigenic sperm protein
LYLRCIAETHYQLGIAQGFEMKWAEAVVSLEAAIKVLETRITNLKAETESPDEAKKDDALHTREKEIAELEDLVPEIKEKITDTNEMKAESLRKMKEAVGFTSGLHSIKSFAR